MQDVQGLSSLVGVETADGSSPGATETQPAYHPGRFISQTTTTASGGGSARAVPGTGKTRGAPRLRPRICCGSPGGSAYDLQDLYSSQAYDFAALQRFSPCCNPAHLAAGTPRESSIAIIGTNRPDPTISSRSPGPTNWR